MVKAWKYGQLIYRYSIVPKECYFLRWNNFAGASYYELFSVDKTGARRIVMEIRVLDNIWEDSL